MSSSPQDHKNYLNQHSLSFILNELGEEREHYFNAVSAPIIQTSNFVFKKVDDLGKALEDEMDGYLYSRGLNPTVEILRKKLAALDGAEDCLVFNSGASAIFAGGGSPSAAIFAMNASRVMPAPRRGLYRFSSPIVVTVWPR